MAPTQQPWRVVVVTGERVGARVDAIAAGAVPGFSKRAAKEMIAAGEITLNGKRTRKGEVPPAESRVEIWREPTIAGWTPSPSDEIPLDVVYADENLLVVNKPSGVPSVPLHPGETRTLAGVVVHRFPECAPLCRRAGDGGLLQRLDTETSGAVMVARNRAVFDALLVAQRRGEVEKQYLALVHTAEQIPSSIEIPLAPSGARGHRMGPSSNGMHARTEVAVLTRSDSWALVSATIHRGLRHQIRVHLASIGAPIVGDTLYGNVPAPPSVQRLFLHAHRVSFVHPMHGEKLSIAVPLTKELSKFVEKT